MVSRAKSSGFTLIEMLVAIAVMALLLLPIMRSFSNGLLFRSRSDELNEAAMIAESALETIAAVPDTGENASNRRQGRYEVSTSVRRYADPNFDRRMPLQPYEFRVTVTWPEGAQTRSVGLRTLRLEPQSSAKSPNP